MHPSITSSLKQQIGSISSPSGASSGYGSSAEDESSISPYNRLSKQSPYDFSQDLDQTHKPALTGFETWCFLSEPFLDVSIENISLTNQQSQNSNDNCPDEVFEIKTEQNKDVVFQWPGDATCQIEKEANYASSYVGVANTNSSSSVDFFTEFFTECPSSNVDVSDISKPTTFESKNIQGQREYRTHPSNLDNPRAIKSNQGVTANDPTSQKHSSLDENSQGIPMLTDLNEIDDMFNFVFDSDENPLHEADNNACETLFLVSSPECNYDNSSKPEMPPYQNVNYLTPDDTMKLSSSPEVNEMDVNLTNESGNKRKRRHLFDFESPSKSQKHETQQFDESLHSLNKKNKFQFSFDSVPTKEDLNDLEELSIAQESKFLVNSQITKDTFLSNFTFQMNEGDSDEACTSVENSVDDAKLYFNTPLDVGEIFSNLQFCDLQSDAVPEDTTPPSDCTTSTNQPKPSPSTQQPNCSYYIIAVPTSMSNNNLTSCIVIKPNALVKPNAPQSAPMVKIEPLLVQPNNIKQTKDITEILKSELKEKQEKQEKQEKEEKAKVLQTILTCGTVRLNANKGSDIIYEDIIRGQLPSSEGSEQYYNFCLPSTMSTEKPNISNTQVNNFKSGLNSGSAKGSSSNILHRLLKGQLNERDIHRRPTPPSTMSPLRQGTR